MAYTSASLFCLVNSSVQSHWIYRTTDALAAVDAAGYITDAIEQGAGKGAPGKGMKVGDLVTVQVVDDVAAPTAVTAQSTGVVAGITAATGVANLLFNVTTAP